MWRHSQRQQEERSGHPPVLPTEGPAGPQRCGHKWERQGRVRWGSGWQVWFWTLWAWRAQANPSGRSPPGRRRDSVQSREKSPPMAAAMEPKRHGDALSNCPPRLRGTRSSAATSIIQRHRRRTNSPCLFRNVTHPLTKLQRWTDNKWDSR